MTRNIAWKSRMVCAILLMLCILLSWNPPALVFAMSSGLDATGNLTGKDGSMAELQSSSSESWTCNVGDTGTLTVPKLGDRTSNEIWNVEGGDSIQIVSSNSKSCTFQGIKPGVAYLCFSCVWYYEKLVLNPNAQGSSSRWSSQTTSNNYEFRQKVEVLPSNELTISKLNVSVNAGDSVDVDCTFAGKTDSVDSIRVFTTDTYGTVAKAKLGNGTETYRPSITSSANSYQFSVTITGMAPGTTKVFVAVCDASEYVLAYGNMDVSVNATSSSAPMTFLPPYVTVRKGQTVDLLVTYLGTDIKYSAFDDSNAYVRLNQKGEWTSEDGKTLVPLTVQGLAPGSGNVNVMFMNDKNEFVAWPLYFTVTEEAVQHSILFDANGGEGASYTQSVEDGVITALTPNRYFRADFTFATWNTQPDGSGTTYGDGSSVTLNSDITLYAQWGETRTITFIANDESPDVYTQTVASGVPTPLSRNPFDRSGYILTGWNTVPDGSGTAYADGDEVSLTDNLLLYAQWEEDENSKPVLRHDIEYDKSNSTVTLDIVAERELALSNFDFLLTWDDAVFHLSAISNGQNELFPYFVGNTETGNTAAISNGTDVTIEAGQTLVTYSFGFSALDENESYDFELSVSDVANENGESLLWKGSTFVGTLQIVTITFDTDGGTGVDAQTMNKGGRALEPATPHKDGFIFEGWQCNGEMFDFEKSIESNITLTATWSIAPPDYAIAYVSSTDVATTLSLTNNNNNNNNAAVTVELIMATYDVNGKMITCSMKEMSLNSTESDTLSVSYPSDKGVSVIKAFVLSADSLIPLREVWTQQL